MYREGALSLVLFVGGLSAMGQSIEEQRFYPEDLREDLEQVRRAVHHLHPDPFRYHDRKAIDLCFDSVSAALSVPVTSTEFMRAMGPALRKVGDAHFRTELPQAQWHELTRNTPLLPVRVRVIDGGLYLEEELMGFRSIPPGDRIVRIDGMAAEEILQELGAFVQTDGQDQRYVQRVVERDFAQLFALRYGRRVQHALEHSSADGTTHIQQMKALTGEEMSRSYRPATVALRPWRIEPHVESHTMWVTMRTLDADSLATEGLDAQRMTDLFLQELRRQEARVLVIDVRGAGGADLGVAETVFSMVATTPYRVVKDITTKQPEGMGPEEVAMYASAGAEGVPDNDRVIRVPVDDPRLALTKPYDRAFTGKVYVVCDGLTRDAGAAFVMMARRSGRARIVGEEVGSNSRGFCSGREVMITLPRSKVRLHVPLTHFVPDGNGDGPAEHGELPHHTVEQQAWGLVKGRDTVKSSLLEMIRELQ